MTITFKTLNTGSISPGGFQEVDWTPDKDVVIRAMLLNERSDKSLSNVQVFISIADVPYTKDFVPARIIGTDLEYCWKPDLRVTKGTRIYVKLENSRADAINVDVVFLYE
ncbi:hypothetical protein [Thermosphaera sp.]